MNQLTTRAPRAMTARRAALALAIAASTPALFAGAASAAPTWLAPTTVATTDSGADSVAVDTAGNVTAVWGESLDSSVIEVATEPAGSASWGSPQILSSQTYDAGYASVGVDGSGNAIAVWQESVGKGDLRVLTSTRGSDGTWTEAETLSEPGTYVSAPKVAGSSHGETVVAWIDGDGNAVAVRRVGSGAWSAAATVDNPDSRMYNQLELALDGAGNATLVATGDNTAVSTLAAGDEAWAAPTDLGAANNPSLAVNASGAAVLSWWTSVPDSTKAKARGAQSRILFVPTTTEVQASSRAAGSTTWSDPATVSLPRIGDSSGAGISPKSAISAAGEGAIGYVQEVSYYNSRVFVARQTAGASTWGAPVAAAPLPAGGYPNQQSPVVTFSPSGDLTALWSYYAGGESPSQVTSATMASGGSTFSEPVSVSDPTVQANGPRLGAALGGDAAATWSTYDGTSSHIVSAVLDRVGPALSGITVPATGTVGESLAVQAAAPTDVWSAVASTSWDFGDGSAPVAGLTATHTYAAAGTFAVKVTSTDVVGNATTETRSTTIAALPTPPAVPTDGPPAAAAAAATPAPTPSAPLAETPVKHGDVDLTGRVLTFTVDMTSRKGDCPTAKDLLLRVTTPGPKEPVVRTVKSTDLTVTKLGAFCAVRGTATLLRRPKANLAVTVSLSADEVRSRKISVTRH